MAGDKVIWTPEMRQQAAEKARARRAAETPEQLASRKAKRAATMAAHPEVEAKRIEKIATTRRQRRDKMSAVAKEAYTRKSEEARAASLANLELRMSEKARANRAATVAVPKAIRKRRAAQQTLMDARAAEPQPKRQANNRWSVADRIRIGLQSAARWSAMTDVERQDVHRKRKEAWAKRTPEQKDAFRHKNQSYWNSLQGNARIKRISKMQKGRRLKNYVLIDGSERAFHSSWEAACANVFLHIGCAYQSQVHFVLGDISYFADFVLGNVIVEVKGYWRAWDRWNDTTLPALRRHLKGDWRVYVLDDKTYARPKSLQDFLASLTLVATGAAVVPGEHATSPVG